jgi:hypothetical protein
MIAIRQHIKSLIIVGVCHVFFLLASGTALVQADGEELFLGKIKKMAADRIVVEVMRNNAAGRTAGEKITVLMRENPRIIDKSRNLIPFKRLSVGSVVRIRPITHPNNDVEAGIIYLVGRIR